MFFEEKIMKMGLGLGLRLVFFTCWICHREKALNAEPPVPRSLQKAWLEGKIPDWCVGCSGRGKAYDFRDDRQALSRFRRYIGMFLDPGLVEKVQRSKNARLPP